MKNSFYFDHDYNARNDQKILELRAEFGWTGYAIYFSLLECLCESKGFIKREALAGLSLGLNMDKAELIIMIDFCLKISLFYENKDGIYSNRILQHIEYRQKLSDAGRSGGRGNKGRIKPGFKDAKATLEAGEDSKGENSKGENSKEEDSKEEDIKKDIFNFKNSLLSLGIEKQIVSDWLKVRAKKKAINSETAFKAIKKEIELSGFIANECIKISVEKSWAGFKSEWIINEIKAKTNGIDKSKFKGAFS
jgi:hypothetical protein